MSIPIPLLCLSVTGALLAAVSTPAGAIDSTDTNNQSLTCSDFDRSVNLTRFDDDLHRHQGRNNLNLERLFGRFNGVSIDTNWINDLGRFGKIGRVRGRDGRKGRGRFDSPSIFHGPWSEKISSCLKSCLWDRKRGDGDHPGDRECKEPPDTTASNTLHEYDLATNPRLVVSPSDVAIIFLEHPRDRGHRDDTHGVNGIDTLSLCFDEPQSYTLTAEIEPDRDYTVEVFDPDGVGQAIFNESVRATTLVVDAGCYRVQLRHARQTRNPLTLFLAPVPGGGTISHNCPGCDLSAQDLSDRDLSGADLSGANLARANLTHTNLDGTNLSGADLTDAATDANAGTYGLPPGLCRGRGCQPGIVSRRIL